MYKLFIFVLFTVGIIGCKSNETEIKLYPCCFVYGYNCNQYGPEEHFYDVRLTGTEYNKVFDLLKYAKKLSENRKTLNSNGNGQKNSPSVEFLFFKDNNKREKLEIYLYEKPLLLLSEGKKRFVISHNELVPFLKFLNKIHEKYENKRNYKVRIRENYNFISE